MVNTVEPVAKELAFLFVLRRVHKLFNVVNQSVFFTVTAVAAIAPTAIAEAAREQEQKQNPPALSVAKAAKAVSS